ncbi:MAG: hypothetical protein APR63_10355 [Desulfuromonas sp. SDB]|nr:MAG: hypothetical protein APR63_10355 [Desulfuromonas sp. SDB]
MNEENVVSQDEQETPNPVDSWDLTDDELSVLVDKYSPTIEEGKIVTGKIVRVGNKDVVLDISQKSEGILAISEFNEPDKIKEGDEVEVFLEELEGEQGFAVVSKKKADFIKVWDDIKSAYDDKTPVEGTIVRRVKGGMIVSVFGVESFLPGSQIDLRPCKDMDSLVGNTYSFRIIKLNWKRRNIVVSRRQILEEEREMKRKDLFEKLDVGTALEGKVKNITPFGAFIDLGGVDGLLHITDISWGRIQHPSEVLSIGDTIQVMVIGIERDKNRVSLGMKQLVPDPWRNITEKYPVDSKTKGKVVSMTDYGAFIELEKGVEGLIHISEMSWTKHIKKPSDILEIGQEIEAVVLHVDPEKQRISLGLKQIHPDPWETIDEKYPVDSVVEGKVRTITNFGAFVQLEEGIDGLIHVSDMSWVDRIETPREILKEGMKVSCKVLKIDKESKKISLGLKQMEEDPVQLFINEHREGETISGSVVELRDRGIVVKLENNARGFVPFSHLIDENIKKPADAYKIGDSLNLKIIEMAVDGRRIVLSEKEAVAEEIEAVNQENQ